MNTEVVNKEVSKEICWKFDKDHSKIDFSVSHMVISHVTGHFKKFEGTVLSEGENFEHAKVEVIIDASSIDTNNQTRDNHLRSPEFIDATAFPKIYFKSTSLRKVNETSFILIGDFTLKGITKSIELNVKFNGKVKDPNEKSRAGFKVSGEINRREYDVNWSERISSGGLIAGEIVEFTANVEIIEQ